MKYAAENQAGLFHTAFLFETKAQLAYAVASVAVKYPGSFFVFNRQALTKLQLSSKRIYFYLETLQDLAQRRNLKRAHRQPLRICSQPRCRGHFCTGAEL